MLRNRLLLCATLLAAPLASFAASGSVRLLVRLDGAPRPLSRFLHADLTSALPTAEAPFVRTALGGDLAAAGLPAAALERHEAVPVASYALINTAAIDVPASRVAAFKAEFRARGFRVDDNVVPGASLPTRLLSGDGEPVTFVESLALSNAGPAHDAGRRLWGAASDSAAEVPSVPVAIIDTGADASLPTLKKVKAFKDATGEGDEVKWGHGSWTHSKLLAFAPWLKSSIHYKALDWKPEPQRMEYFLNALSMARQDGAIVVSGSWGWGEGEPDNPVSLLVKKMAEEGRIMVFSAANGTAAEPNMVWSPAIVYHRDAATGALRVLAVASTNRFRQVAKYSSRGPGSPITSTDPKWKNYPQKPDLSEVGELSEGSWPLGLVRGPDDPTPMPPDRIDPVLGPLWTGSGTSASSPKINGTIAHLAMLFGVTTVGPRLDAISNAVMKTLIPNGVPDDVGQGFNNFGGAYEELVRIWGRPTGRAP